MAGRIRTIKPEWLEDERLGALSDAARLLSVGLILLADDWGNGRAAEPFIVGRVWGYSRDGREAFENCSGAIRELVDVEFLQLYEYRGQRYFHIRKWFDHQKVDKPGRPLCPVPAWAVADLPKRWRKPWQEVRQKYGVESFGPESPENQPDPPNGSRTSHERRTTDHDHDRYPDHDRDPRPGPGGAGARAHTRGAEPGPASSPPTGTTNTTPRLSVIDGGAPTLRDRFVERWQETFREHRQNQAPTTLNGAGLCVSWLEDEGARLGLDPGELLEVKLSAYWAEDWPTRHRSNPTPRNLHQQLPRLASPDGEPVMPAHEAEYHAEYDRLEAVKDRALRDGDIEAYEGAKVAIERLRSAYLAAHPEEVYS